MPVFALFAVALLFSGASWLLASSAMPGSAIALQSPPPPGESDFRRLSASYPEFAGYHFDENLAFVVSITTFAPSEGLRATVDSIYERHAATLGLTAGVRVRQVQFSFAQLEAWRAEVWPVVARIDGVYFIDLDELENSIVLGVDPNDVDLVHAVLESDPRTRTLPVGAVRIHPASPLDRSGGVIDATATHPASHHTLNSDQLPVQAGFRIEWPGSLGCSIGWVNYDFHNSRGALVGASHCSRLEGVIDTTMYFQATVASGTVIGYEVDEAYEWLCNGTDRCHYGDVNVIALLPGISFDQDQVGRPAQGGGTTIYHAIPTYTMIEQWQWSVVGMPVSKVGRTTGYTNGTVTNTCVHYKGGTDWWSMCLDAGSHTVEGGDSGSPVFTLLNAISSTGRMAGITSGRWFNWLGCWCYRAVYTPVNIIFAEFPYLTPLPE
jgi:hypothetical protein